MKTKNIPERMCIVCRKMFPKTELMRLIKTADGAVEIDSTGKSGGRGAYICLSEECKNAMIKHKSLNKTFKQNVSVEQYQKIAEAMDANKR